MTLLSKMLTSSVFVVTFVYLNNCLHVDSMSEIECWNLCFSINLWTFFFIHLLDTYLKQVQILLNDHRFDDRHVFITCSNCFTGYGTNTMNAVNFFLTKVVEKSEVIRKSIGFREEISAFKRCRLETIFSHIYNRLLRLAVRFME